MKKIKLRHIEVLSSIIRTGSLSEAARELGVSQPAISKTLKQTEKELNISLFKRSRGGITATPEAKLLYESINHIDLALKNFDETAYDISVTKLGKLKLTAPPAIGNCILPHALEKFRKKFPFIPISICIQKNRKINETINFGQADIGVVHFPTENTELMARELNVTDLVCVMRKDHPLAKQNKVTGEDLCKHALIICNDEGWFSNIMKNLITKYGIPERNHIEVNQFLIAFNLATRGMGIALIDRLTLINNKVDRSKVLLKPFDPIIKISTGVIYRRYSPLSEPAKKFIEILEESLNMYSS